MSTGQTISYIRRGIFQYLYEKGITHNSEGVHVTSLSNQLLVEIYNSTTNVKVPYSKKTFEGNFSFIKTTTKVKSPKSQKTKDRRKEYREYLKSDAWQQKRAMMFGLRGRKCEKCDATDVTLQIHHLTYANIFNEPPEDLQIVCIECHEKIHNKKPRVKKIKGDTEEVRQQKENIMLEINQLQCRIQILRREFKLLGRK